MMVSNDLPMVSICMITYNHAPYIAQAIEGVMMQKTNFKIELIIGEDCSSDNTRAMCKDYQLKYPERIHLLLPDKNSGALINFINTLEACTGKYIALCEGDDYWTDPYKLQKQVDFLEKNISENVIAVVTNCSTSDVNGNIVQNNRIVIPPDNMSGIYNLHDFFGNNHFYPTLTIIFDATYLKWITSELLKISNPFLGDWILFVLLHSKGNVGFINEVTASYRINPNSLTHTVNAVKRWESDLVIRRKLIELLPKEYHKYLNDDTYAYHMIGMAYRKQKRYIRFILFSFRAFLNNPLSYMGIFVSIFKNKHL